MKRKIIALLICCLVFLSFFVVRMVWSNQNLLISNAPENIENLKLQTPPTEGVFRTNGKLFSFSRLETSNKAYILILDKHSNVIKKISDERFSYYYGNFGRDRFYYIKFDSIDKRSDLISCSAEITKCEKIYSTVGSIAHPSELENGNIIFQFSEYNPALHKHAGFISYNFYILEKGASKPIQYKSEAFAINGPIFVIGDSVYFSASFTMSYYASKNALLPVPKSILEKSDPKIVDILKSTRTTREVDGQKIDISRNDFIGKLVGNTIKISRIEHQFPFQKSTTITNIIPKYDKLIIRYATTQFTGRYVFQNCVLEQNNLDQQCIATNMDKTNPALHGEHVYYGEWNQELKKLNIVKHNLRS